MDKSSSRVAGRPRRLRIRKDNPDSPAASATRSGAGDGVAATASGRHRQASVGRPSAATCKRRNALALMPTSGQNSTPEKPPQASNCSQHQAACRPPWITTRRSSARPAAAQAGACSRHGGATRASQPPSAESCARTGNNRPISPKPLRSTRISVRFPRGQPPPGNSASSSAYPLGRVLSCRPASVSPRQISPLASTSESASGRDKALMTGCWSPRESGQRQSLRWQIRPRRD